VLNELARFRFDHYETHPVGPGDAEIDSFNWPQGDRVRPPAGWLPPGLFTCEQCGEIRGTTWGSRHDGSVGPWESTCICEGVVCRKCGDRRIRRPISDHYELDDGHFWHTPYFVANFPCRGCREEDA
jgi:hypothetical protein